MSSIARQTAKIRIPAMDCPEELVLIEKGLRPLRGLGSLAPDYIERLLHIQFDPQVIDPARICAEIRSIGFAAEDASQSLPVVDAWSRPKIRGWTIAGGVLLVVATVAWWIAGETNLIVAALATASAIASGVPVARAAWRAVRLGALDMNVLMTIAAVGAVVVADYFEAATAMFLIGASLWLESYSLDRARRAVQTLVQFAPSIAHRLAPANEQISSGGNASLTDVHPDELRVGDCVLVRPGERIPIDGTVLAGESNVNQAPITGESLPIQKTTGERVFAGTLNGEGSLEVRVDRPATESTLAHVARLVQQAQAERSPTERFIDRFARRYTPAVIALAVLVAIVPPLAAMFGVTWASAVAPSEWFHRALVLLVIACPCALVISTPVTIVCGLHQAARRGMLVKGGEHLENAGRIDSIALDKTGTLTTGELNVAEVDARPGFTADEVLRRAAALEWHSEHPLAVAIVAYAQQQGCSVPTAEQFQAQRGFGVAGVVEGTRMFVGSERFLQEQGFSIASARGRDNSAQSAARTAVFVATADQPIGTIWLSDTLRDDAADAIAELRALGVRPIAMVTGDRDAVARETANALSIDEVYADLLPEDKVARVRDLALQRPYLAMVGDGVNDAPALAAARLGIALGSQASDTALETADVVMMSPRLRRVPELIRLGRRCRRLLVQNITFAFFAKGLVLLLAGLGWATMWMAVAADVGASLVVIANGMRLLGRRG